MQFYKDNGNMVQIADLLIKCNNQFVLQKRYGIFACEKQTLQIIWYKRYNHNINRFYCEMVVRQETDRSDYIWQRYSGFLVIWPKQND